MLVAAALPSLTAMAGPLDDVATVEYEQTPHGLVIHVDAVVLGVNRSILIPNVTQDALEFDFETPDVHIYWNELDEEWDVYTPEEGDGLAVGNNGTIIEHDLDGEAYKDDSYEYSQVAAHARLPHSEKVDDYLDIKYIVPLEDAVDTTLTERLAEADFHLMDINLRPHLCGAELLVENGSPLGYHMDSPTVWWVFEGVVPPQLNNGMWLGVKEYCG